MKLNPPEPQTPEEVAIKLILDAKIETDEDYRKLALLIDNEVADRFLDKEPEE